VADIVQAAGHPVGFMNPSFYSIAVSNPAAFHQITTGCSLVKVTPDSPTQTGYCAHQGWNYVTGLGSPDAVQLLRYFAPHASLVGVSSGNKDAGSSFPSFGMPMIMLESLFCIATQVRPPKPEPD
jgi:subtilase family serine protease